MSQYRATSHWKKIRLKVLQRDAYTCAYCGDVADQVDHVYPKSKGGQDELDNLVAACKPCNYAKRDRTDIFLASGSTPPAFPFRISPKEPVKSESVRISPTTVKIDPDSPFSLANDSGANGNP